MLRINSHGGGVAACIAMRRDLERFKARTGKPVVACLMDTATGGAYYLASAADHVVADPSYRHRRDRRILNLFNLQDLMAQFNVIPQSIKAGELVDIGSSARPLKAAEQELLQTMADEFHEQLMADVQRSRPQAWMRRRRSMAASSPPQQAMARGLVDRSAIWTKPSRSLASWPAAQPCGRPQVVLYRRDNDPAALDLRHHRQRPATRRRSSAEPAGARPSKLPTFLSIWQPELTMEKLGGK